MNRNNMMFTLEEHFEELSEKYEQVREVYSLWVLIKKDISEKLNNVCHVFPYFSKHDASHSRTIITNIELFLGEDRIRVLSATDTFMLLICAYLHDYGMALELGEILEILMDSDGEFRHYLENGLSNESVSNRLLEYYEKKKSDGNMKELYHSIIIALQDYNRPKHWKGVEKIDIDYKNLFLGRVKARFVKSIVKICQAHGKDVKEILNLSRYSTGMFADVFHPRFIAAMIRLGDLLDLDNNRFSQMFAESIEKNKENIPKLSKIHYLKHEAITHFFIGPTHIDIEASCQGEDALLVARELYNWIHWLETDCAFFKTEWDIIAQRDFGTAPRLRDKKILVDGTEYQHFVYDLRMELPSDKIFNLLAGSNVYDSKYVAFREIIQNAIDATLLQMWQDFYNGITTEQQNDDYDRIFANWYLSKNNDDYKIYVNVIEDTRDGAVYVEVIDQGIGIDDEDLKYMCRIGENNICNPQRHQLISKMPDWLIPSGVFGIGLQSAFQLTDEIEFFTKKANRTPRHIRFSSYSSNKGKIEVSKCHNTYKTQFDKISTQGTLVRLKINSHIYDRRDEFAFFDLDFDHGEINEHVIRVEIIKQFMHFFESIPVNYFPIKFCDYKIDNYGHITDRNEREKTNCCIDFYKKIQSNEDIIVKTIRRHKAIIIYFWDSNRNLFLTIEIPPCEVLDETNKIITLNCVNDALTIKYKFNQITEYEQLFEKSNDKERIKSLEFSRNIIKCTIDILDKDSDKYLNIDRTILKNGGINYNDILEVEKKMFTAYCKKMVKAGDKAINGNLYFLPILSLLFARFTDKAIFKTFIKEFTDKIKDIKIRVTDKTDNIAIPLLDFLSDNNSFGISQSKDKSVINEKAKQIIIDEKSLYEHFPRNFFVPVNIKMEKINNEQQIVYYCKIRNEFEIESISIDEKCWENDCLKIMESDSNQLVKSALKPIEKYKELFVNKLPKTFKKGIVYDNILDKNISLYILSPFDDATAKMVFDCKSCTESELESRIKEIESILISTQHFKKCVNFVKNNSSKLNDENTIKQKYLNLVKELIEITKVMNITKND